MRISLKVIYLIGSLIGVSANATEVTSYVSDELPIHVRTGPTEGYRIAYFLTSGTPVVLVGETTESGYQRITDPRGRDGWIEAQWLAQTPSAKDRLANALLKIEELNTTNQQKVASLQQSLDSSNAIVEKSKGFQSQISELQTINSRLTQQNEILSDRFRQESFFAGALVITAGAIIGVVLGRLSKRKRSGWN